MSKPECDHGNPPESCQACLRLKIWRDADEKIAALQTELAAAQLSLKTLFKDTADTDTYCRDKAATVLGTDKCDGDSYGVPPIETLVDWLVGQAARVPKLEAEAERLKTEIARGGTGETCCHGFVCKTPADWEQLEAEVERLESRMANMKHDYEHRIAELERQAKGA